MLQNILMNRLLIPLLTMLLAAAVVFCETKERPNIVFIFSDDHATQALGAYESIFKNVVRIPPLDKLASQGMVFDRCLVTNSICGPMRAVIQTGTYSHLNGFWRNNNRFDATNQKTFPKLLQQAGYHLLLR